MAQATEQLGFDGFFRSDHYLQIGDRSEQGERGASDAWVMLAGLARDTERIRLGTLVSPTTFRHPGPLAVQVAQVDQMSRGRIELGVGAGWYEAEHAAYAIPYPELPERFDRFAEQVEIVDGLWRTPVGGTYNYDGRYYQLTNSPGLPKPAQSPRPPIILGGQGKTRSAALAARFADEYNVGFQPVAGAAAIFDRIRAAVAAAGRAPETMTYSFAHAVCVGRTDAEIEQRAANQGGDVAALRENAFGGTPAEVVDKIRSYVDIGASTIYLQVMDFDDLDQLELIADEVLPLI
ncbi:MAG: putative oxidoreductase [Frankiales bacterium]|nr:putative oxidoreductase [Frankiales bacterium]